MKNKFKTRKINKRNKNKNKYRSKSKKYIKRKQRRVTRKKHMRGGTIPDGSSRFDIQFKTNEIKNDNDNNILQKHFLIINDKIKNKKFLLTIDNAENVKLFLFERNVEENKDNIYLFYINYINNMPIIEAIPFELIKKYINNDDVYQSIISNEIEIYDKIQLLSGINSFKFLSINIDDDVTEIVNKYVINKDDAISKLNQLNETLMKKCPNLEMRFDYLINQPGIVSVLHMYYNSLTLCLYNQGNCISSVNCMMESEDDNVILTISSRTNPSMQGRNFNKLLRAAVIIIANHITVDGNKIQTILSNAQNPTSAFLLLKYFNAKPSDDYLNYKLKQKTNDKPLLINYDFVKKYIKKYGDIQLLIELNDDNVENAQQVFDSTVINCDGIEREWNGRIITKAIDYMTDEDEE